MSAQHESKAELDKKLNDPVDVALELALEDATDPGVREHIREAMQLRFAAFGGDE